MDLTNDSETFLLFVFFLFFSFNTDVDDAKKINQNQNKN